MLVPLMYLLFFKFSVYNLQPLCLQHIYKQNFYYFFENFEGSVLITFIAHPIHARYIFSYPLKSVFSLLENRSSSVYAVHIFLDVCLSTEAFQHTKGYTSLLRIMISLVIGSWPENGEMKVILT